MKATKLMLGLALAFTLAACGPENKPVTEPLSLDERAELINKDIEYGMTFALLDALEKRGLDASEKKTLEGLSYKRLNDFLSVWGSAEEIDKKKAAYGGEWEKEYGSYRPKVDSIDNRWKQFMEGYQTQNYLKIELADIVDKTNVFMGEVKARLRFTPLKGRVNKVEVHFGLLPKGAQSGYMRSHVEIDKPFSSPMEVDDFLGFNYAFDIDASKVNDLPVSQLLEEYDFRTNIIRLVVDGRTIDYIEGYNQVPDCVRSLWKARNEDSWDESSSKERHYNRIYQELVDPSMPAKEDYVGNRIKEDAYAADKLAATLYYEIL